MYPDQYAYQYKAFGFNLASDYALEGLLPSQGAPTVFIRSAELPVDLPGAREGNAYQGFGNTGFAFRVGGVAAFYIGDGTNIFVEQYEQDNAEICSLFILGTCMGVLLSQRGLLPMHGSALSLHDRTFIITGHSGAGKSTLAAALHLQGYAFLTDDIAALEEDQFGFSSVLPAFPKQKLWRDAAEKLYGQVETLERIPGIRDKYHVPVPVSDDFIDSSRRLDALFELNVSPGNEVRIAEVKGAEKLALLIRNTFRLEINRDLGTYGDHFAKVSRLAAWLPVFRIERPADSFTTDEQIQRIKGALESI